MKCNIRLATDQFHASLRSREREKLQVLNGQLKDGEEKRESISLEVHDQLMSQIENLQNYYSVTQADMTDKIIHKRIALFYEKSETVNKYFLSFGRKHPRNHIHALTAKKGALITENREILREAKNFYQELFTGRQLELEESPLVQDFLSQD